MGVSCDWSHLHLIIPDKDLIEFYAIFFFHEEKALSLQFGRSTDIDQAIPASIFICLPPAV